MRLAPDEQAMLDGKEGHARQKAMELLVKYGEALGAENFVDTNNVLLNCGILQDVDFIRKIVPSLDPDEVASKLYLDSDEVVFVDRVKAFSTNNVFRDQSHPDIHQGGKRQCELAHKMEQYSQRIGVVNVATCAPYQVGILPTKGEHCAWNESSAIAFCNSVLGARTNIEGNQSGFASALTGKTPYWGMHLDENRVGNVIIDIGLPMDSIQDMYLLGYYVGAQIGLDIPVYTNISKPPTTDMLMSLCASGIASGSTVLFHMVGVTPEAPTLEAATGGQRNLPTISYGNRERRETYQKLNHSKSDSVDVVILGCPHYGLSSIKDVSILLEGKTIQQNTLLYISTSRMIKTLAHRNGYADVIEKAGGVLLEDTCGLFFDLDPTTVTACDSAKMAHYLPGTTGVQNIWCGTQEECIDAALNGKWRGELR